MTWRAISARPYAMDDEPAEQGVVVNILPGEASPRFTQCEAGAYTRSHFSSICAVLSTLQPKLSHECVLELLKLSSNVNE
jgi:hypothetical protein